MVAIGRSGTEMSPGDWQLATGNWQLATGNPRRSYLYNPSGRANLPAALSSQPKLRTDEITREFEMV